MKYRIVAGGIHIESSTFTPYISGSKDFTIREGESLKERYPWSKEYEDIDLIPLTHAGALPGGVVERDFYEGWLKGFKEMLTFEIEKAPIHGVLMDIHGAMSLEGSDDAEGELLDLVRGIVGPDIPISTSMDLHGNVSSKLFKATDLLTCYRTAPHIDTVETRHRAFKNLIEIIKNGRTGLIKSRVDVPVLLPGEKTSTEVEPGRGFYKEIDALLKDKTFLDASIYMGFPWADQERCHGSVVVIGYDKNKVEKAALKLGQRFWDLRKDFQFVGPVAGPKEAINLALESKNKPFFISDTGDNPGAGGADDMVVFLGDFIKEYELRGQDKKVLFASIMDEGTMEFLWKQREGESHIINLGGKIDPSFGGPLNLEFKIKKFFETPESGKGAIISRGNFDVIVTSTRHQYSKRKYFIDAGAEEFHYYDVIVVKMGYLEPDLSKAQRGWVMALTGGAVDQDLKNLKYKKIKKPLYPMDDYDFNPNLQGDTIVY